MGTAKGVAVSTPTQCRREEATRLESPITPSKAWWQGVSTCSNPMARNSVAVGSVLALGDESN